MFRRLAVMAVLMLIVGLVVAAPPAEKAKEKQLQPVAQSPQVAELVKTLGGDDRYLTYVSTDKPIYRPGETLLVRGVPLHYLSRKPLAADKKLDATVEIKGPKGDSVASGMCQSADSVFGFNWPIPDSQAGGEYTIHMSFPFTGQPPAERKFDIRDYRAPRLKTQIKFIRDGYGAGDEVVATLHAERAEGGLPAGSQVTVTARVDDAEAYRGTAKIDDKGNCQARFKLPKSISRGEGTLVMAIEDGGVVETASKTIPILLQSVDLTIYPEGGDLVAGLSNRVYFEAFTPAHKPADLAGVVLDAAGKEVATFRSQHEGRGRFTFTPAKDTKYTLKITEPSGIKTEFPLPEVKPAGVVLASSQLVVSKGDDVKFSLAATAAGVYRVSLQQREQEVSLQQVELAAGESKELTFSPGAADGVLRATVWNAEGKPLAERLIFRRPRHSVQVKLTADAKQYVPGGQAKITVKTFDENDQPISAVVGLTATDDSVLEMIDKREQAPRLPVMVLLEADVKELADAHVYLDPKNELAPTAVDLLLGTQGWRRFAMVDAKKFAADAGDPARRVLALKEVDREVLSRFSVFADDLGAVPFGDFKPVDAKADRAAGRPQAAAKGVPINNGAFGGGLQGNDKAKLAKNFEPAKKVAEAPREALQKKQEQAQAGERKGDFAQRGIVAGGGFRAAAAKDALAEDASAIRNDFVPVRVFAHQVRSGRQPADRTDFTETLFWNAGIRTDAHGEANIEFGLNDAVTSFRVFGDAFSDSGALGSTALAIESVQPFYLEPKLPLEVTTGDWIRLPLGIVNATSTALGQTSVEYDVKGKVWNDSGKASATLPANGRVRQMVDLHVGKQSGDVQVTLNATAGPYADKVVRSLRVRPLGFPAEVGIGGLLAPGETASHDIVVPETLVAGSLEARAVVYPTPLASMTESLAALIREPCGCFEQTSSTVYPLIMAQQYFMSHQGVDPSLVERSSQILQTGYDRLRGFESKSGGFEWFGGDPGHDALTAYGLMEFTDMSQVRFVDPALLQRTSKWLAEQRDNKGGYVRKTHTLHTWIADPECANAYNTWSLLETGTKADMKTEVKWIRDAATKSSNTYAVALSANVLALAGDKDGANQLLDKLSGKQQPDGSLSGATTSVIGSGGEALTIETTALAVMAWLKNPRYAMNVEQSIKYLAESCKCGRFGSTQSTILALKAIVAYDQARAQPKAAGSLQLVVDGKKVGSPVAFDKNTSGAIELPNFAEQLPPGKHQVQLTMTDGSSMPYSLAVTYHSLKPNSSEECKLHLEVNLRDKKVDEGAATEAHVVVINRKNEAIPTPIAIIGIPGGLEVRHDQLKELVKSGKISAYEVLGREVVLYWRSLDKEARVDLSLSLIAAVPGKYTGPASRGYLYYTDEHKQWCDGLQIEIQPKGL